MCNLSFGKYQAILIGSIFAVYFGWKVTSLDQGDLDNLPSIAWVKFDDNEITTVSEGLLDAELYPDGHPKYLFLGLSGNPLQCDSRMCWIKEAERTYRPQKDGWLQVWYYSMPIVTCQNQEANWNHVNLDC